MTYPQVWMLVLGLAVLAAAGTYGLIHRFERRWLRLLLCLLVFVWLIVPAPVPNFPGSYAPAFVVLIFEGLFQSGGDILPATLVLSGATVLAIVIVVALTRLFPQAAQPLPSPSPPKTRKPSVAGTARAQPKAKVPTGQPKTRPKRRILPQPRSTAGEGAAQKPKARPKRPKPE